MSIFFVCQSITPLSLICFVCLIRDFGSAYTAGCTYCCHYYHVGHSKMRKMPCESKVIIVLKLTRHIYQYM